MASVSIPRPRRLSERQYLGDLTSLFERQRRRSGLALTPDSFANDLAANDSLSSGLFTLCTAISHMAEDDLSGEALLSLVARALGGAEGIEGTSAQIPDGMRTAFLKGYEAWSHRELRDLCEPQPWPPVSPDQRKPAAREESTAALDPPLESASGAESTEVRIASPGRRTVQEALSLVRKHPSADHASPAQHPTLRGANGEDLGSMTLSELKHFLEDIEQRMSRLAPHLQQLNSIVHPSAHAEREESDDSLIPFRAPVTTGRRANVTPITSAHGPASSPTDFNLDAYVRRHSTSAQPSLVENAVPARRATPEDDRPPGIDALLAAAPAWASASPSGRPFDEDSFLSRHAYLAPTRRPGANAPASLFYVMTPTAPLAPPVTALPAVPTIAPVTILAPAPQVISKPAPALFGLDTEDDPLLSPMERLQAAALRLHPRRVFTILTSLTLLAGGLAGLIAYRALHSGRVLQFKDLEPSAQFAADVLPVAAAAPAPSQTATPQKIPTATAQAAPAVASAPAVAKPKPHVVSPHSPVVLVWPPPPAEIATTSGAAQAAAPNAKATPARTAATDPGYVSSSTMIGYALSAPQPVFTDAQVRGTVVLEIAISRLGDVVSVRPISGPVELRPAALAAARAWRFRPYMLNGKPAEVTTTLQFSSTGK